MRRYAWMALLLILVASPARAAEPRCPLDIATCLSEFGKMRERPWLGVEVDTDSAGVRILQGVAAGSPAEQAGLRAGDVLLQVNRTPDSLQVAGRAGWGPTQIRVRRGGHDLSFRLEPAPIPEAYLARIIGVHMIEAHLAYAHTGSTESH